MNLQSLFQLPMEKSAIVEKVYKKECLKPHFVEWDEKKELGKAQHRKRETSTEAQEPKDVSEQNEYDNFVDYILHMNGFKDPKIDSKKKKAAADKLKGQLEEYYDKQAYVPKGEKKSWRLLLNEDLSRKLEKNLVRVFCDLDSPSLDVICTEKFSYIDVNRFREESPEYKKSDNLICKCDCQGGCKVGSCRCIDLQEYVNDKHDVKYLSDGRLIVDSKERNIYSYLLVRCGVWCSCPKSCPNRLENLYDKSKKSFEVYRHNFDLGFGVRTLASINLGEFVFEFLGRVLTYNDLNLPPIDGEPDNRRVDYAMEIFKKGQYRDIQKRVKEFTKELYSEKIWRKYLDDSNNFFIDPYSLGNVARFMSCSCFPNLAPVRVVSNFLHPMRHQIFMVAIAPIAAGTELTFDYGKGYKDRVGFNCVCGVPLCQNGPMKEAKKTVPFDLARRELTTLYQKWKQEAEDKDERLKVIEIDDEESFWKTNGQPRMQQEPPYVLEKALKHIENQVNDPDWEESQFVDRRRTDLDVFHGEKREHPDAYEEESYKRMRLNISPERDYDSDYDNDNIRNDVIDHDVDDDSDSEYGLGYSTE